MNLKAPLKDAEAFADYLTKDAGFAQSHVVRIYDKEARKKFILSTLSDLGQKIRPDDLFVFYVNCHGSGPTPRTRGNYLLLYDFSGPESYDKQLLMQELSETLRSRIPAERLVLIVQACHSGFAKAGSIPSAELVSEELQGRGRIIATACTGYESSWVYKKGGVFTMALIPNLRRFTKLKEALEHTQADVIAMRESENSRRRMHPVIKYDQWIGDDAVLKAKPIDPIP